MDAGTLELVELDTRLDFDDTPKCETGVPCDAEVKWIGAKPCCNDVLFYCCTTHRHEVDTWLSSGATPCLTCGTRNPTVGWTPLA